MTEETHDNRTTRRPLRPPPPPAGPHPDRPRPLSVQLHMPGARPVGRGADFARCVIGPSGWLHARVILHVYIIFNATKNTLTQTTNTGWEVSGSMCFCLALNFKHIALYYATGQGFDKICNVSYAYPVPHIDRWERWMDGWIIHRSILQ